MSKNHKDFKYYFSKPLGLEFAIHIETGYIIFSDGIKYNTQELDILKKNGKTTEQELINIHNIKSVFSGVLVE